MLIRQLPPIWHGRTNHCFLIIQILTSRLQISAVPTFVLFDKEKVFGRFSGADQNQLEKLISDLKKA